MRTSDLVIYSAILYALRLPPCILFLIRYRNGIADPVASLFRSVMIALVVTVAPRISYLWDPALMLQFQHLWLPLGAAVADLFGSVVWCTVAWWLYLLFEQYRREAR